MVQSGAFGRVHLCHMVESDSQVYYGVLERNVQGQIKSRNIPETSNLLITHPFIGRHSLLVLTSGKILAVALVLNHSATFHR